MSRRRMLGEIDPDLLDAARSVLGTTTIRDTIDAALREVVRDQAVREHLRDIHTLDGLDLDDPEVMVQAWVVLPGTADD
jgi:Arc/MetJ family transcription regulator